MMVSVHLNIIVQIVISLNSVFSWRRFLQILEIDGPTLLRLKFLAFFIALNYEAESRELAGAITYNLGSRDAKGMLEVD